MPSPSLPLFVAAQQHAQDDPEKMGIVGEAKQQSFTYTQLLENAAGLRKQITNMLGLADLDERRIAMSKANKKILVQTYWPDKA